LRLITEEETRGVLTVHEAAEIVDATYRSVGDGSARASTPSFMSIAPAPHRIGAKGAILEDRGIAGVRLTSRVAPRLMIWSLADGQPIALFDEIFLYRFRTGVSAAVVARHLLPDRPLGKVAIVGAGPIAMQMAIAMRALLSPRQIVIAARRPESAADFARKAHENGTPVAAAPDIDTAARDAELIVTITTAREELLLPRHAAHGPVVLSMGGGLEVSHDIWAAATARFVDDLDYALHQGDAAAWIEAGTTSARSFEASLTGTVADFATRRWRGEGTGGTRMAIIQGMTALDVALAHEVYLAIAGKEEVRPA